MHRQKLSKKELRKKIWKKAGGVCAHCGHKIYGTKTVDHVIPKSAGGSRGRIQNMMPLCRRCNMAKGSKWVDPWTYYRYASEEAIWDCVMYANLFYGSKKG